MAINTEAFIQSADADESTECTWRAKLRVSEDKKAPRVIRWGQKALVIFRPRLHLLPQQLEHRRFLILLVLRRLALLAIMRQIWTWLPPFPFQCGLTRSSRFSANNTAGLRPLFKRLIGCCLGREAISEVSVTAEKV